ncbi:mRNA splicing protein, partial [Kickxella alabastrina]
NIHGFTVSLDKRLAADGRGLEDVQVSDGFARLAEALGSAESHAREEIAERAQIQQTLARREKEGKEERLRLLAQRAREERAEKKSAAGAEERAEYVAPPLSPLAAVRRRDPNRKAATDFFNEPGSKATHDHGHEHEHEHNHNHNHNHNQDQDQDQGHDHGHGADAAVRERDQLRAERRKQHERDLRQQRSGGGSGKKPRDDRDVSEKIALGLAKPTSMSRESMFDSRLFNQPSASNAQLQNDEAYNLYDKPLFSSAPHQTYRPRADADDGQQQAGDVERLMESDRFGGQGGLRGGAKRPRAVEAGKPVVFEKEADVFGIDAFVGSTRSSEDKRPRNQ